MTTGLLGDTSFLDTLQQASQVLNDRVSSSPFGNYTPSQASDYVVGPLGGIAQNRFMGNQFQMPNLFNAQYIPEAFNASSVLNAASTSPFNYNFGSYTPGAFNQFYGSPMASPAMATTTTRTGGGGGRDRMGPGVSTEFVGDRGFRINADGSVSMLDPDSLDYKLNNLARGLLSATPSNLLGKFLQGEPTTAQRATVNPNNAVYDRIAKKYGEETAQDFMKQNALAINKELQSDEYQKFKADLQAKATTPSGALTPEEALLENLKKQKEGLKTKGTKNDPGGLNKAREASKDRAAAATGKSRGFFGGR